MPFLRFALSNAICKKCIRPQKSKMRLWIPELVTIDHTIILRLILLLLMFCDDDWLFQHSAESEERRQDPQMSKVQLALQIHRDARSPY